MQLIAKSFNFDVIFISPIQTCTPETGFLFYFYNNVILRFLILS